MISIELSFREIDEDIRFKWQEIMLERDFLRHNDRLYRKMWEFRQKRYNRRWIENEIFGMTEEILFSVIVFRDILMPIKVIRMKICQDSIISIKSIELISHEARDFEHYMSFFFSFFTYFEEDIGKSSTEIPTQINRHIRKSGMQKMEKNR